MSISAVEIDRDRRRVERALKRREQELGKGEHVLSDEVDQMGRDLYGRPVRIEIDVCVPLDDLKKMLNMVRADLTNAILMLERGGSPHDRRFACHRLLSAARAKAHRLRLELEARRGHSDH
jgi:hypothetical protein